MLYKGTPQLVVFALRDPALPKKYQATVTFPEAWLKPVTGCFVQV